MPSGTQTSSSVLKVVCLRIGHEERERRKGRIGENEEDENGIDTKGGSEDKRTGKKMKGISMEIWRQRENIRRGDCDKESKYLVNNSKRMH